MSQPCGREYHLQYQRRARFLYLDGEIFFQDFVDAFMQVLDDLNSDEAVFLKAAARLKWMDEDEETFWWTENQPTETFQYLRN